MFFQDPNIRPFGGMEVVTRDAQQQARTVCDVKGFRLRPKVPSKRKGRKGTRRVWKRRHPPHWVYFYREPTDVIMLNNSMLIVTPQQADWIRRATIQREPTDV